MTDSCTVKAYAVMPDYLNSSVATQEIVKVWGIGDTMGKPDHGFTTDGSGGAGWTRVMDATAQNGEAMKSGAITHDQSSELSTTVMGPGTARPTTRFFKAVVFGDEDNIMVQLWEDGPYWATKNIGASEPWEYGYYFWWGDVIGYRRENDTWVASDGSLSNFSFGNANTPTYNKSFALLQNEGWITADGVLTPKHDAAHVHWSGLWRMPTKQELSDLNSNCDRIWTTMNGVNGYVFRGRGDYASASTFLPCAGRGSGTSLSDAGSYSGYWSSVPDSDGNYGSWYFDFGSSYLGTSNGGRYNGRSIRPVRGFAP